MTFARLGLAPYAATDVLPAACGWREMCRVFQVGEKQFYKLAGQGAFVAFELHPAIGPRKYSGDRLMRYLRGESVPLSESRATTRLRLARAR